MNPGDIFLTTSHDFYGTCITIGQTFKYAKSKYATWTHCGIILNEHGDTIEALTQGVVVGNIQKYADKPFQYIQIPMSDQDRGEVVGYSARCVGRHYGWTTIASIGLSLLTGLTFHFGFDGDIICSGLVANSLCRADIDITFDPKSTLPADIAAFFKV